MKLTASPRNCLSCGNTFVPHPTARKGIYCSARCRQGGISRATAERRGDTQRDRGSSISYRKRNGRHEHRVVAEQLLGRPLRPGEIVHHRNGNKRDNRPENLQVLESRAIHSIHHSTKNRTCSIPDCDRKHVALGLCSMHWQRQRKAAR